ncbi:MAG: response regulator [Planctomycetes bacterium]|nr:response regulator [Planctomycetota bacterium]
MLRVMVIDDSKTMRNIEKSILNQLGYTEIEEACNGQDALTKVAAFNPDLLLLDWNMPNMDGLTFVKTYREQGNKTPIIMVTTENEKTRIVEAIKAGVQNYVVKPFTPDVLGERIADTMAKAEAA